MEAESDSGKNHRHRDGKLQWGRLTMEAERFRAKTKLENRQQLQWGRLTMEAERWRSHAYYADPPASMGPPHDGGGETGPPSSHASRELSASMGPPHDGGGERIEGDHLTIYDLLQWGRLTMEAESAIIFVIFKPASRLQWGRLTMEAESPR